MNRPVFAYRPRRFGVHVHVRVFAGNDLEHLALCGELHMRAREWDVFSEEVALLGHTIQPEPEPETTAHV